MLFDNVVPPALKFRVVSYPALLRFAQSYGVNHNLVAPRLCLNPILPRSPIGKTPTSSLRNSDSISSYR